MKKRSILLVSFVLIVVLSCVAALAACSVNFEVDEEGNWDSMLETREEVIEFYEEFFKDTLANTNQVVTSKFAPYGEEEQVTVETIDGTTSYLTNDGIDRYVFVQDGKQMYAIKDSFSAMYKEDEIAYDMCRYEYTFIISVIDSMDADATYLCSVKGDSKGKTTQDGSTEERNETFTLTVTDGENKLTATATAKNGLVVNFAYTNVYIDDETGDKITDTASLAFVYGSAHVELPDMSDWEYIGE